MSMITGVTGLTPQDHGDDIQRLIDEEMPQRQKEWCEEFLASGMNGQHACEKIGYQTNWRQQTARLLSQPLVKAYIQRELFIIQEARWIRRQQLLDKMERLNDFNLMNVVTRGAGGWLEVSVDDYERVAQEIGDCVTEVEVKDNGSVRIKLMDKDKMFDRELKYHGVIDLDGKPTGNVNVQVNNIQGSPDDFFDKLCEPPDKGNDPVEARIVEVEALEK